MELLNVPVVNFEEIKARHGLPDRFDEAWLMRRSREGEAPPSIRLGGNQAPRVWSRDAMDEYIRTRVSMLLLPEGVAPNPRDYA